MKTDRQLTERFLELQEHPERLRVLEGSSVAERRAGDETSGMQVTDEHLQQTLDDPQMQELVEQMAFAKRAFKNEDSKAEEPDVEGEWEKFAAKHFDEGNETQYGYPFKKMVASFIGVILVSGMAFAAIHIVRHVVGGDLKSPTHEVRISNPSQPSTALPADTVKTDTTATVEPVVFDNVPLEKMLTEIAAYYHAEVSFLNDDARQLRFHFVWKREDGLGHAIEKLNRFESLSVRLDEGDGEHHSTKIIVE